MLISVLGFGSIWTRRVSQEGHNPAGVRISEAAYYNTTGVLVGDKLRNRPCTYGVARFNGKSGFRPDCIHRMLQKVFECEPPCVWNGHNKVLFKKLLGSSERPDAYLVTITADQSGGIHRDQGCGWLHHDAHLISFSECSGQQEVMLVMPAYTWVRGRLGTFFVEPVAQNPRDARLILSATI
ncbi:MAG: hypothetical protein U0Q18_17245 [Bryobacteraceae bacterium]